MPFAGVMQRTDPSGCKALTSHWSTICASNLHPQDLGSKLIQARVVQPLIVEQAMSEPTTSAKLNVLLNDIVNNGTPGTFNKFLDIIGSNSSTQWLSNQLAGELQ